MDGKDGKDFFYISLLWRSTQWSSYSCEIVCTVHVYIINVLYIVCLSISPYFNILTYLVSNEKPEFINKSNTVSL